MTLGSVVGWIICGLLVGWAARMIVPGRQEMSLPLTVAIGIVGALAGGFLFSYFGGAPAEPFSLTTNNWFGWTVAILGGVLAVGLYSSLAPRARSY